MNKFEEYKKLRKQGYKAAMARRRVDATKSSPVYKTDEMMQRPLKIRKNGFVFYFSLHQDEDCVLLRDLGHFTDTYEEGAFAHDHYNNRTYNWFIPANFTEFSWFTQQGMSKGDAHLASYMEARQQYELAKSYGDDWEYHDLHGKVYVDHPDLDDLLLSENWLGGIDVHYNKMEEVNAEWLSEVIDEQISQLLPEAFQRLAKLHQALGSLTIANKAVHAKKIADLAHELEIFGATFLSLYSKKEITEKKIIRWCEDTLSDREEDWADLLPRGVTLDDWIEDIIEHAPDLSEYFQEVI